MKQWIVVLVALLLVACNHVRTGYDPVTRQGMTWDQAVSVVEQGFYEDYGPQKTAAVVITDQFIALDDGTISTGQGVAYAAPVFGGTGVVGSTTVRSRGVGQRLYFKSLGRVEVFRKKMRDHRFAVIITTSEGATARRVFFRSESRAEEFADAVEYLKQNRR